MIDVFSHHDKKILVLFVFLFFSTSCTTAYLQSIGGNTDPVLQKTYLTDYNTAWQAVLEALKNNKLDVTNQEGGYVQTKWVDNTAEKNFVDSFGSADTYLKAQSRFRISLTKSFYQGSPIVKINVQKEQLIQRDVLEGWKPIETDSIDETTLLYRIGRIIFMITELLKQQQEALQTATQPTITTP